MDTVLAIRFAAGKSQDVQAFLKLTHVIAVKVWQPQIQRAISKLIAFIDKQHPCGGVNVFTKRKIMIKTESSNGFGGGRTIGVLLAFRVVDGVVEPYQSLLNIFNGSAGATGCNRIHGF